MIGEKWEAFVMKGMPHSDALQKAIKICLFTRVDIKIAGEDKV
jgi:hypothetical protein